MTLYLLEILVTGKDKVVCEPLGIYTSYKQAEKYLDLVEDMMPEKSKSLLNIIPFDPDEEPAIIKLKKSNKKSIKESLLNLYKDEAFEQMVEPDGSFSYMLNKKHKTVLEKAIFDSDA